jgi:hypothetical protein
MLSDPKTVETSQAEILAVFVGALITVGSAVAATGGTGHTVTQTENFHGVQMSTDANPCTGNAIDLTQTSNIVQHVTFFRAGTRLGDVHRGGQGHRRR